MCLAFCVLLFEDLISFWKILIRLAYFDFSLVHSFVLIFSPSNLLVFLASNAEERLKVLKGLWF